MDYKTITILIAGNLEKLSKKLENCFTVISEQNGRQAIKTLRENAGIVDAVILDLMSFDVLAEIRADDELSQIPVIAVTPENSPESCKLALDLGAVDFVSENTDKALAEQYLRDRFRGGAPDEKERKRAAAALARRGFDWGTVKSAMRVYEEIPFGRRMERRPSGRGGMR